MLLARSIAVLTLPLLLAAGTTAPPDSNEDVRVSARGSGAVHVARVTGPPMTAAQVTRALHARLDSLASVDAFSGAVLLAHGDTVLLRSAWGLASRKDRTPNTAETRFNIGSINKAFTRAAIEQLAAAGKLHLTDTVDRWLSDYPKDKGSRITIQQLLDHRGGTGDIFNERYQAMDHGTVKTIADWMNVIRDNPLEFEPGTKQAYSNAGYVLLGAIVEKASGESYYDYVRTHVYAPAGMTATDSYLRDPGPPNRATGYTRRDAADGAWRENTAMLPGRGSPAGGGYSTVDDLKRFADALRSGKLGGPRGGGIGMAGGSPGCNALLEMEGDWTLVVLANQDPPAAERVGEDARGWLGRAGGGGAGGPVKRMIRPGGPDDPLSGPGRVMLPPGGVDVPMTRAGHLPAVEVMVNGQGPFLFGIDTGGAGAARIDSALAAKLGLARAGEVMAGDPSGKNMVPMALVHVESIELGGARFEGLNASVRNYNEPGRGGRDKPIDGILGFGLFGQGLFTLDYPHARVKLVPGELPAGGPGVIAYGSERGIPHVPLRVAGRTIDADVDAGAMGGFSLPASLADSLPLAAPPKVVGRARTVTNTFEIKGAELRGEVALGDQTFTNPSVTFQPLFPMANVGARVLQDFVVTFDETHQRMRLAKP